jgi:DNA-binding Lrp family transcriptional regulator
MNQVVSSSPIDDLDRRIIKATQGGLPFCPRPYDAIAAEIGLAPWEVMARLRRMLEQGIVRRIGAVPNHYRLGYVANGMSVWDVPDDAVSEAGRRVGSLDFVSHSYRRPRHPPLWPYNLFAMVHGRVRAEVEEKVARIAELLGPLDRGHDIVYSTRILKKTGLRLVD